MMLTPLLALLARRAGRRIREIDHDADGPQDDGVSDHVVIGGFGRVGQMVARLLEQEDVPYVALDLDAERVAEQRKAGRRVFVGDASRKEMLERIGAAQARAVVVTLDAPGAAERMVGAAATLQKDACVLARAKDADHAKRLTAAGAVGVVPEAVEASLQLAGQLLGELGLPDDAVDRRIAEARAAELERLRGQHK
jgi:CPA2 family monovalent cation:H+ antiporter-2